MDRRPVNRIVAQDKVAHFRPAGFLVRQVNRTVTWVDYFHNSQHIAERQCFFPIGKCTARQVGCFVLGFTQRVLQTSFVIASKKKAFIGQAFAVFCAFDRTRDDFYHIRMFAFIDDFRFNLRQSQSSRNQNGFPYREDALLLICQKDVFFLHTITFRQFCSRHSNSDDRMQITSSFAFSVLLGTNIGTFFSVRI